MIWYRTGFGLGDVKLPEGVDIAIESESSSTKLQWTAAGVLAIAIADWLVANEPRETWTEFHNRAAKNLSKYTESR